MIDKKQDEIINNLNNLDDINRFKELEKKIKNNKKYNELVSVFEKNKTRYEKEGILNQEIINLRKELFEIDEVREYAGLESQIRLFSKKTSKKISSIVKEDKC